MLLQRFHLALAVAAAAVVVLGFVAGASVWHVEAAAREVLSADSSSFRPVGAWGIGGLTLAVLVGLVAVSYSITTSFRRSLQALWRVIDDVQAGRLSVDGTEGDGHPELSDDELLRAARALERTAHTLSEHTVSRSYLHDILDSMAEMLFVTDGEGRIRYVNRAVTECLNTTDGALNDVPLADLFDTDPLAAGSDTAVERTLTAVVGAPRPVLVSRSVLRRSPGEEPEMVCVAQDVTALKEVEDALQQSLAEKDVLLREVHHRVKNNLQVVCSLLHAEAQAVRDLDARRRFEVVQQRIRSMTAIHEQLYRSDDLSQVDFGAYLRELGAHLTTAHGGIRERLHVDAESIRLPLAVALPAGIIVHELVANAFEHAHPEEEGHDRTIGSVTVTFRRANSEAALRVCDDGVGPDGWAEEDARKGGERANTGVGLRLVRGLTRQLRGTLRVTSPAASLRPSTDDKTDASRGTCVSVSFPLDDKQTQATATEQPAS